jgi:group I intron endonuclease
MNGKSAVYSIFCKTTGKAYIGSSNQVKHRRWVHFNNLNMGTHHSVKLQRSWNKHTPSEFVFSILEFCSDEILIEREQFYIDAWNAYDNGYNSRPIAESSRGSKRSPEAIAKFKATIQARYGGSPKRGRRLSENTKALIRAARAKQTPASDETRRKIGLKHRGNKYRLGIKHTTDWINSRKGRHLSPDTEFKPGRIHSPTSETISKISAALSNKPLSFDHRARLSCTWLNKYAAGYVHPRIKTYQFVSPAGTIETIINLKKFCETMGLSNAHMNAVFHSKRKQHKGWKKYER